MTNSSGVGSINYESERKYWFPTIAFDSELVGLAFELERLRGSFGYGTTPPSILGELHGLFQLLMSVVSARIEGNRTTIYDALEHDSAPPSPSDATAEGWKEIVNLRNAMTFIDQADLNQPFTHVFVRELHRLSVQGLVREGDRSPGQYRSSDVEISRARHLPPSHVLVHSEMTDLLDFANQDVPIAQQMVHVAMAHHRFLWVHPFHNGNGRVSRLLSYAMLRRHGFVSPFGYRTVNPPAVFGNDRDGYYASLAAADDLSNEGTVAWCTFFVRGIYDDMERLTRLQDRSFVEDELTGPALRRLVASGAASAVEAQAMGIALRREVVKAGDLASVLVGTPSQRSVAIRSMVDRGLLVQDAQGPRFYRVPLSRGPLANFVVRQLDQLGFLPRILRDDAAAG